MICCVVAEEIEKSFYIFRFETEILSNTFVEQISTKPIFYTTKKKMALFTHCLPKEYPGPVIIM